MSWDRYGPDETAYRATFGEVDEDAVSELFESIRRQAEARRAVRANLRRSRGEWPWAWGEEPRWTS